MEKEKIKKQALSPRHVVATQMARVIRESKTGKGLVNLTEENNRKFYQTEFNKGKINVYGEDFIQVIYDDGNKRKGEVIFESANKAARFYRLGFIEAKWDEALKIPTKAPKEENNKEEKDEK